MLWIPVRAMINNLSKLLQFKTKNKQKYKYTGGYWEDMKTKKPLILNTRIDRACQNH